MAEAKITLSAEDKTRAAFESAKAGLGQVSSMATAAGFSLATLGAAGTVAALVTMVKEVAHGVDALNDLKDATGASIENISALESVSKRTGGNFDTVSTSLIKFNQVLLATKKPGSEAEEVLKAIGLNAKQLREMDPAEALLKTATALNTYADDGKKAVATQVLFAKSLKEVAPFLKDLAEAGALNATVTTKQAEEAEKFNKELYKLSANSEDTARKIAGPLITSVNDLIERFRLGQKEGDGFLTTLYKLAGIGPAGLAAKGLGALFGFNTGSGPSNGYTDARKGIENINEALKDTSLLEGERNAMLRERLRLEAQLAGYLNGTGGAGRGMGGYPAMPKQSVEFDPDAAAKAKAAAAALKKELEEQAKLIAELAGLTGSFAEDWNRLNVMFKAGKINVEQLTKAQADLLDKQPAIKKAREEEIKVNQAWNESMQQMKAETDAAYTADSQARERVAVAITAQYAALKDVTEQLELEAKLMGATDKERQIAIAHLKIEQDLRKQIWDIDHNSAYADSPQLRELEKGRLNDLAEVQKRLAVQRASLDEFQRVWASIDQAAHDAFINIFEGGSNAFKKLGHALKASVLDLLYQMTLKKWIFSVGASVSGGAMASGGGGGVEGVASNLGGSMLTAGGSSMLGGVATAYGEAQAGAVMAAVATGAETSIVTGMGAGITAGLAAIPVYGWIALAAMAIYSYVSGKGGGPKTEAGYAPGGMNIAGTDILGNQQGSQRGDVGAAQQISQGISSSYAALAHQLGLVNDKLDVGIFYSMDNAEGGTSLTQLQVTSSTGYNRGARAGGIENVARGEDELKKALAEETIRVMVDALRDSDLAQGYKDILNTLTDDSGITEMQAALTRITAARTEQLSLEEQLYQMTATDSEKLARLRTRERAAVDPLNAALLEQVYAQQDLAAATAAATAQAEKEAARAASVASEREGLEMQLLRLQGNTDEIHRRELAALDESNRAIQERIWALEDEAKAVQTASAYIAGYSVQTDAMWQAQMQAYYEAERVRLANLKALFDSGQSISQYVQGLQASRLGTASPEALLAANRSSYISDLSLAKAGNLDASNRITNSAQAYLEAQKGYSASGNTTQAVISQVVSELKSLPQVQSYESQVAANTAAANVTLQQVAQLLQQHLTLVAAIGQQTIDAQRAAVAATADANKAAALTQTKTPAVV